MNIPRNLLDVISETFTANPLTGTKRPAFSTNRLADINKTKHIYSQDWNNS